MLDKADRAGDVRNPPPFWRRARGESQQSAWSVGEQNSEAAALCVNASKASIGYEISRKPGLVHASCLPSSEGKINAPRLRALQNALSRHDYSIFAIGAFTNGPPGLFVGITTSDLHSIGCPLQFLAAAVVVQDVLQCLSS